MALCHLAIVEGQQGKAHYVPDVDLYGAAPEEIANWYADHNPEANPDIWVAVTPANVGQPYGVTVIAERNNVEIPGVDLGEDRYDGDEG